MGQSEGGAAPPEGSGRILIVDDNADAAETLGELLKVLGYEVRSAGDAKAALEVLASYPAQVGLLDIGLPQVDGYELAGRIRQLPIGRSIRLVALTGYGSDEDRQRARAAGFDEHMVKPVNPEALMSALNRLLP